MLSRIIQWGAAVGVISLSAAATAAYLHKNSDEENRIVSPMLSVPEIVPPMGPITEGPMLSVPEAPAWKAGGECVPNRSFIVMMPIARRVTS